MPASLIIRPKWLLRTCFVTTKGENQEMGSRIGGRKRQANDFGIARFSESEGSIEVNLVLEK